MKLESSTQRRLSIARVLVWIAIIAVSLAAFRSRRPVMIVLVLPLSLYALCFDLARTLRPDFFRSKSLHAVLLGDRPLAETIGIRESSHNLSVRVAMDGAFPWLTIDELGRTEQALTESGFPLQTAQFVLSALQRATGRVLASLENGEGVQQSPHHVSALELYKSVWEHAHVVAGDGRAAMALLEQIGLRSGADVGRLVTVLVELNLVQKRENESLDDFRGLPWPPNESGVA